MCGLLSSYEILQLRPEEPLCKLLKPAAKMVMYFAEFGSACLV